MNAIVLAAGSGERLKPYTENLPKGMLGVGGQTLIERHIDQLRSVGVEDITIATGFRAETIDYEGVQYTHNPDYASTNMVETLMTARQAFIGETIIAYADIAVDKSALETVIEDSSDIGVLVDTTWQEYWAMRYAKPDRDLESLALNENGEITEIGKPTGSMEGIDGRYVGLLKFSANGVHSFLSLYDKARAQFWSQPWQSSSSFQKAYMTDMLQALIENGTTVNAIKVAGGWLEFDTVEDYELFASPKATRHDYDESMYREAQTDEQIPSIGYSFLGFNS